MNFKYRHITLGVPSGKVKGVQT